MTTNLIASAVFASIAYAMFQIGFAWTPLLGLLFAAGALGAFIEGFQTPKTEQSERIEVVIKGEEASVFVDKEDLHRDVHFNGKTGSEIIDPRTHRFSEEELEMIVHNAKKALAKGKNREVVHVRT